MPATATVLTDRATINRANSQYSTGPRTAAGKQRSSQNALRHGLTARTAVLASEDQAAYEHHCSEFHKEYQPATTTEIQLVQELADTSWRLKRIPILEAALFDGNPAREQGDAPNPQSPAPNPQPQFEVPSPQSLVPHLAALGLHGARLSRQFQKTLDQLRDIQFERRQHQRRELRDAAAILELHKHKGIPWQPSDHGFVFSKEQVERCSERMMRQNEARYIAAERFNSPPLAPAWEF